MAVKLRLQRLGRKKIPYYHIIAVDGRKKRDGAYLEQLGKYNPLTVPAEIEINTDRTLYWLDNGAQPTDTVRAILKYKGVMYKRHLLRGVKKGALTPEQAEQKWQEHVDEKQRQIVERLRSLDSAAKDEREKRIKAETAKKEEMLKKREAKLKAKEEEAAAAEAKPEEAAEEEGPKTIDDVAKEAAVERGDITAEEAAGDAPTEAATEEAETETPAEESSSKEPEAEAETSETPTADKPSEEQPKDEAQAEENKENTEPTPEEPPAEEETKS